MYASDDRQLFSIPRFTFYGESIDDYKRIRTFPNNNSTCNNSINLFKQQNLFSPGLFEESFFQWPNDRILFKENDSLAAEVRIDGLNFAAGQFNQSIRIIMNFNTSEDTTHILTAAIIDLVESYYLLPLGNATHCFNNIWFDLVEARRRSFDQDLKRRHISEAAIQMKYGAFMLTIKRLKRPYMKETERGTRIAGMQKWNKVIPDDPGIDNMAFSRMN